MAQKKFELKAVFTIDANDEKAMQEFEKIKNDVLSGKSQREMLESEGGLKDVKMTFTELK